jgi:hypothetical protein
VNSRVSELRRRGYRIEHRTNRGAGALAHSYRLRDRLESDLIESLAATNGAPALDRDAIPRDLDHRYRIYRMVYDELELVGTARTKTALGGEIIRLAEQGGFERSCVGLLDTHGTADEPGSWLINPWDTNP